MNRTFFCITILLLGLVVVSGCETIQGYETPEISYAGTGEVVDYHANGRVKRKTDFVDGHLVSTVSFYASGTMASEEEYAEGKLTRAVYYFKSGDVKTRVGAKNI